MPLFRPFSMKLNSFQGSIMSWELYKNVLTCVANMIFINRLAFNARYIFLILGRTSGWFGKNTTSKANIHQIEIHSILLNTFVSGFILQIFIKTNIESLLIYYVKVESLAILALCIKCEVKLRLNSCIIGVTLTSLFKQEA